MKDIIQKSLEYIKSKKLKGIINVFVENEKNVSFSLGKIDELTEGEKGNAGIKVIDNEGRVATSVTNIITEQGLLEASEKCCELVKYSEPDEFNDISNQKEYELIDWAYDIDTENTTIDKIMEMAKQLEDKAKSLDDRIKFVRKSNVSSSISKLYFANTNNIFKKAHYSNASAVISLSAVEGEESSMGFGFELKQSIRLIDIDLIAKEAVDNAIGGLKAKILNSGRKDIILSPFVTAQLLSVLMTPLSGENVCKGKSFLKDKIGEKIANEKVNLIHDPMSGSAPIVSSFDNEGINTKRFSFIENGVLKTYANNIYSANALKTEPTGNAFASPTNPLPSLGSLNMHLVSNSTRNRILNSGEALYVTNAMGLHTVDPISGRFSIQISGRVVREGNLEESFRGMTMAGTVQEMLNNIDLIASDFKYIGYVSGSTTLIKDMSVGGK